jgi:hypothetical protein
MSEYRDLRHGGFLPPHHLGDRNRSDLAFEPMGVAREILNPRVNTAPAVNR